jgi:hypothetical protein
MNVFLKALAGSFVGRIAYAFVLALAVAVGFGPEEWVKAVLPFLEGPVSLLGARLVFIAVGVSVLGLWGWSLWSSRKPTEHVTRIKYSSRQTITRVAGVESDVAPNFSDPLNLDNVATLIPFGAWDLNSVEVVLQTAVPVNIKNPLPGQTYPLGGGRAMRMEVSKGVEVSNLGGWVTKGSKRFIFSTENKLQIIEAGGRKYRVELTSINDTSTPPQRRIEYLFAISEV